MSDHIDIDHVASLARIDIDAKTRERMKKDLSSILDYVEILQGVRTEGAHPRHEVFGLTGRTRADGHRGDFPMDEKLAERLIGQAPNRQGAYVKVRGVLKGQGSRVKAEASEPNL